MFLNVTINVRPPRLTDNGTKPENNAQYKDCEATVAE